MPCNSVVFQCVRTRAICCRQELCEVFQQTTGQASYGTHSGIFCIPGQGAGSEWCELPAVFSRHSIFVSTGTALGTIRCVDPVSEVPPKDPGTADPTGDKANTGCLRQW